MKYEDSSDEWEVEENMIQHNNLRAEGICAAEINGCETISADSVFTKSIDSGICLLSLGHVPSTLNGAGRIAGRPPDRFSAQSD